MESCRMPVANILNLTLNIALIGEVLEIEKPMLKEFRGPISGVRLEAAYMPTLIPAVLASVYPACSPQRKYTRSAPKSTKGIAATVNAVTIYALSMTIPLTPSAQNTLSPLTLL
jgi:hypothetical protein